MRYTTLIMAALMLISMPLYSKPSKPSSSRKDASSHNQKYTLKRRKKAGGLYRNRKIKQKSCFWVLNVRYCKTISNKSKILEILRLTKKNTI